VYYAVFCLIGDEAPINAGGFRPIEVLLPPGSALAPQNYRAVSAGNVETSQRIVDTVYGALAQALPDVIPAASNGSMSNVLIGGFDTERGRRFTYYETLAGGAGGGPGLLLEYGGEGGDVLEAAGRFGGGPGRGGDGGDVLHAEVGAPGQGGRGDPPGPNGPWPHPMPGAR